MQAVPIPQSTGARGPRALAREPREGRIAAILLGVALLALWTWWALADGGFFGVVMLPGAIGLYLVLIVTVGLARLPIRPRGAHALALAALLALAAWTALSLLWSPSQELALDYAQRGFAYAAAFLAGLAFTIALRRRMALSVAPFLLAGAITAVVVVVKLLTTADIDEVVDLDGQLDYPLGYRNANAGFFAMVAFGAMTVTARRRAGIALRAGAATLSALALSLAAISQSRGSLLGVAAGVVALLAFSPERARALLALLVAAAPVGLALTELLDPFAAAESPAALDELAQAARISLAAAAGAGVLAGIVALLDRRLRVSVPRLPRPVRLVAALLAVAAVVVAAVVVGRDPVGDVADQIDRAASGRAGYEKIEGSRFTYVGGLNRVNLWQVAVSQAGDDPLRGGGAGSFRPTYLVEGNGEETPRNAHSLPLEMLGELGVVGLALLLVALGAACWGAWRSRRLGPDARMVSAAAFVVAAVGLTQAAVDWSWFFGAQMAPLFALLGSACAPAALGLAPLARGARIATSLVAGLLALIALPTFLSERLTFNAAFAWRSDVDGAYTDLDKAADLNLFANTPLLVEAEIAKSTNDPDRALAALAEAESRSPDDWRSYLLAGEVLARNDPAAAREQVERARELNPSSPQVAQLRRQLSEGRR